MSSEITWDGITIAISHRRNWLNTGWDHLELRAGERLPVTTTGYRSHFIHPDELASFTSAEDFVRQWLDQAATGKDWQKHLVDRQQLSLF